MKVLRGNNIIEGYVPYRYSKREVLCVRIEGVDEVLEPISKREIKGLIHGALGGMIRAKPTHRWRNFVWPTADQDYEIVRQ